MERDIKALVQAMTLEEKAGLCSGADSWHLKGVERLGIPSIMVSDGPHGLRKVETQEDGTMNRESIPAVCFPTACATACSFDRKLLARMGEALGEECQAEHVAVLLGPAVNIKRSPLCGRNFEYFSEDPYLASQMATAHIQGVQSRQVGTSLKHFAANNQEYRRMSVDERIDERTLREIYLAAFETAVREAKPETVMCSYNKINGEFLSENRRMLTEILREEWGFFGVVMSDWGAVNDRVKGLAAGLDLEMPGSNGVMDAEIVEAVRSGKLPEEVLDTAAERLLRLIFRMSDRQEAVSLDWEAHHRLAREMEEESMVLLKNEGLLPLAEGSRVAFIGGFAKQPRFQGGGSSHIHSFRVADAWTAAQGMAELFYSQGYEGDGEETNQVLLRQALETAAAADVAVIFAGLPDSWESEGYDRSHMRMPEGQNQLIREVCRVQPNTVVVLHNGSPVEMPWADAPKAILEAYLGGQAVGEAVANVLFGRANPSGKLAETIPYRLEDNPSYLNFPGDGKRVDYREGIFVGYRYYEAKKMPVRYPFGHGLSYTEFAYRDLEFSSQKMEEGGSLTVSLKVKNTGSRAGKEVVQLYVADRTGAASRPPKELKQFEKVELQPGEEKTVSMTLDTRSFAWYQEEIHGWYAASGEYEILVGASSQDIRLRGTVAYQAHTRLPFRVHANTTLGELMARPETRPLVLEAAAKMLEHVGRAGEAEDAPEAINQEMALGMQENCPLRALRSFAGLTTGEVNRLVDRLNQALGQGEA